MGMQNLDISQFSERSAVNLFDRLLLVTTEGNDGSIKVNLIVTQLRSEITPSINSSGMWLVGGVETGVQAIGKTPQFKQDPLGIVWKYDTDSEWKLLVPWSEIKFTFDELTEAQKDELTPKLEDFSDEEIAELQRPAVEMIARLQATDDFIKSAESQRVESELLRSQAETVREGNESLRVESENARAMAESTRVSAESLRESAETKRLTDESLRLSAELERKSSEAEREKVEQGRVSSENLRVSSEEERVSSESARKAAESTRESNESERKSGETDRKNAESLRSSEESKRKASESARESAESQRVSVDNERKEDYAALREDIVSATKEAWAASAEVRNIPIIKDGTWWTWDVDNDMYKDTGSPATSRSPKIENGTWWTWNDLEGVYTDTGESVSADYQLTKEKIESVFTGDIQSHSHSRYVEKIEGKGLSTEDFTLEEKEKLAGLENFDPTELNEDIDVRLSGKQDANIYFTDIQASSWVLEGIYRDFKYRCDIPLEGVTDSMFPEIVFGMEESSSGDYSPVCSTGNGFVTIWSATDKAIVIPTIIIQK